MDDDDVKLLSAEDEVKSPEPPVFCENEHALLNKVVSVSTTDTKVHYECTEQHLRDLDVWRKSEQAKFHSYLLLTEQERISELESEYQVKQDECEALFAQRQLQQSELEKDLKETLFEIEKHEQTLNMRDEENRMKQAEIIAEYANMSSEIVLPRTRMQEEQEHEQLLIKRQLTTLKKENEIIQRKIGVEHAKTQSIQAEMHQCQEKLKKTMAGKLQQQLCDLELESSDLSSDIQERAQTIGQLRNKLGAACHEYLRLQKSETTRNQARLYRERMELHDIRLHSLAGRHGLLLAVEKRELSHVRRELSKLKKIANG